MKHPLISSVTTQHSECLEDLSRRKNQCCVENILIISHFTWFVRTYKTSKSYKIEDIKIFDDYTLSFDLENQLFTQLTTSWNIVGSRRTPYHPEGQRVRCWWWTFSQRLWKPVCCLISQPVKCNFRKREPVSFYCLFRRDLQPLIVTNKKVEPHTIEIHEKRGGGLKAKSQYSARDVCRERKKELWQQSKAFWEKRKGNHILIRNITPWCTTGTLGCH